MFTGKQQRDGIAALPFIVPGLFAFADQPCAPTELPAAPRLPVDGTPGLIVCNEDDGPSDEDEYDADNEAEAVDVRKRFCFDWAAYHAAWANTPYDRAVTALFAEYASLYSRISGQVRSTVPPPMTLARGLSIAEQASRFVTLYVNPILGEIHSTKVHKLLCHIMSAIRWHGDLQNGNTASNESEHKHDKPFYSRTNKHLGDFTRQLVVHARGSHAILRRLDDADGLTRGAASRAPRDGQERFLAGQGARAAPTGVEEPASRSRGSSSHNLQQATVGELEARPDLVGIAEILGQPASTKVRLVSSSKLRAVMDCGTPTVQVMHVSDSFYGSAWYDAVLYQADGSASDTASVGVVRAVLRKDYGDVAIIAEMEEVEADPGCPLSARGCARLAWRVIPGRSRVALRLFPVSSIRRLLLLMPDFADLTARRGVAAVPLSCEGDPGERLKERMFVNDFHPWHIDGRT